MTSSITTPLALAGRYEPVVRHLRARVAVDRLTRVPRGDPSPTVGRRDEAHSALTSTSALSLFFFAAGEDTAHDGYRLLRESAVYGDTNGFEAVWTPERHFHPFGGAYPNPAWSVRPSPPSRGTSAFEPAASCCHCTRRHVSRRNGRSSTTCPVVGVDLSFAAGWQPNDFVLNPGAYATAREQLPTMIESVRRLWRGDTVDMPGHDGAPVAVRTLPRPVQAELPVWLTSAGSTSTFERPAPSASTFSHICSASRSSSSPRTSRATGRRGRRRATSDRGRSR